MTTPNNEEILKTTGNALPEEFGEYLVYERLRGSGTTTVHRAKKRGPANFEHVVALKRIRLNVANNVEFVESFAREARLASMLTHDNIGKVYDFGRVGHIYFIAMEYAAGITVTSLLRHSNQHRQPPPINVVLSILSNMCEALEYAHNFVNEQGQRLGIVHGEVTPSNVLIARAGHVKVIEFGIARGHGPQPHAEGGWGKGKLGYMSPEALLGRRVSCAADVFSVGVIAHELLTGQPLFTGKTDNETMDRLGQLHVPRPSELNKVVPSGLDQVVLSALERDDERRLQSAYEFRQALEAVPLQEGVRIATTEVAIWLAKAAEANGRPAAPTLANLAPRAFVQADTPGSVPDHGRSHRLSSPRPTIGAPRGSDVLASSGVEPGDHILAFPASSALSSPAPGKSPASVPRRATYRQVTAAVLAVLCALGVAVAVTQFRGAGGDTRSSTAAPSPGPTTELVKLSVQPPDSIVEIGGKEVTRTSPFETRMERGIYPITVSHPGYTRWTSQVELLNGSQTINVALKPAAARVHLSSDPDGLVAELDGQRLAGPTPIDFEAPPGQHQLAIATTAGTWSQSFTAAAAEQYRFDARLPSARPSRAASPPHERAAPRPTTRPAASVVEPEPRMAESEPPAELQLPVAALPSAKPEPTPPAAAASSPSPAFTPAARPTAPPMVAWSGVTKISGEIRAKEGDELSAKICIDVAGRVATVTVIKAGANGALELQKALMTWSFKPYRDTTGRVSPACFPLRLVVKRAN